MGAESDRCCVWWSCVKMRTRPASDRGQRPREGEPRHRAVTRDPVRPEILPEVSPARSSLASEGLRMSVRTQTRTFRVLKPDQSSKRRLRLEWSPNTQAQGAASPAFGNACLLLQADRLAPSTKSFTLSSSSIERLGWRWLQCVPGGVPLRGGCWRTRSDNFPNNLGFAVFP